MYFQTGVANENDRFGTLVKLINMQEQTNKNSLDAGVQIGRYEIREILGVGGFGITYKAWDTQLNRIVAIKEYLPAETAVRTLAASTVQAQESKTLEYHYGLQRFLDEAKTLAKFHHPNIIGVHDYIQANNTAYLIMTYEQGQTLGEYLKQQGGKLPEIELKEITKSILIGLQKIHEDDYYHRDIKPGNIYIRKQGEPVLIDFGAARQAIGTRSRSLTNIVSAGYAPNEQYGSNLSKQGPWTDLYALGATMYRSISGQDPVDSPTRSSDIMEGDADPLIPAITIGQGRYSEELLQLIDWMLAPAIKHRPQNVTQVLSQLQSSVKSEGQRSTVATQLNQEARSTVVTAVVAAEKDYQSSTDNNKNSHDESTQHVKSHRNKLSPCLSKLGLIGISVVIIASFGISKKQNLHQLLAEIMSSEGEIPSQSSQNSQGQQGTRLPKFSLFSTIEESNEIPVTLESQNQQTIQALLAKASTDIKQQRLSSPKGNNAVEKYQQILQLDPENKKAQQGFTEIVEKYLQLVKSAQQKQQFTKARELINRAKNIQEDNLDIRQAEEQLKLAEQNYQPEVIRKTAQVKHDWIAMVKIQPGCFEMGDGRLSNNKKHQVCLTRAFALGKYEVTQAQWQQVMGYNPSHFEGSNRPVEKVSWIEVQKFISTLNKQTGLRYRLPTEAEWEYACRNGGKPQKYCGGNNVDNIAWYTRNARYKTHNVGLKQANWLGLHDMSGNVSEWTCSKYDKSYGGAEQLCLSKENIYKGNLLVLRGGYFKSNINGVRGSTRIRKAAGAKSDHWGFRLARSL